MVRCTGFFIFVCCHFTVHMIIITCDLFQVRIFSHMNSEIAQIEQQIKNFEINDSDELESFDFNFSQKGAIQEFLN